MDDRNHFTVILWANDGLGDYRQEVRAQSHVQAVYLAASRAGVIASMRDDAFKAVSVRENPPGLIDAQAHEGPLDPAAAFHGQAKPPE